MFELVLLAQTVADSLPQIVVPGVPPDIGAILGTIITVVLGIVSSKVYEGFQKLVQFMDGWNGTVKMLINPIVAGIIALAVKYGSVALPADLHQWTVENINVTLVTVVSFISHNGMSIKSLKGKLT